MKFFLALFLLGQILMAAKIDSIEINGINVPVIFEEDKRLPLVTTQLIFQNAGSIRDTKIAGLAKFSSRMLNEGTKTLGANGFAEELESRAIHISANCGKETFVIEVSSLKEEYVKSLKYLKELLKDPNYSEDALQKVQTTMIGGLSRKANDFDYIAAVELNKLLFEGSVLAQPSSGEIDTIKKITLKDVKKFIEQHICLSRAIVLVGGDVTLEDVKKQMGKVLQALPKGKAEKLPHFDTSAKSKELELDKETQQAYIYFGSPYNMAVSDEDYYKARVATFILGTGGFGSRLMEEIRVKRGLAYSAYARVEVTKSRSYLTGYLQTKLESSDEAKKVVQEVFKDFVTKGVTEDELEQTKKFLLGSEPLRVETMSQRLNRTFQEYYKGFALNHSQEELEKISALKLDDLNEFIKKHTEILQLSFAIVTKK
ncbi:pitrilysin family protein [Sulfurimonas sp. C5]|uniref:M16 family metallopeptidase n=1 Tax=Sulfurimonas sp. C5 TaxID=3036947 RepID=UPI00245721D3|nr:pitrilysin family protein [Sulfurimonas sp. C5]MDH4945405.1 pitrilysin family protein [Sulfurimonas sp. C5]